MATNPGGLRAWGGDRIGSVEPARWFWVKSMRVRDLGGSAGPGSAASRAERVVRVVVWREEVEEEFCVRCRWLVRLVQESPAWVHAIVVPKQDGTRSRVLRNDAASRLSRSSQSCRRMQCGSLRRNGSGDFAGTRKARPKPGLRAWGRAASGQRCCLRLLAVTAPTRPRPRSVRLVGSGTGRSAISDSVRAPS